MGYTRQVFVTYRLSSGNAGIVVTVACYRTAIHCSFFVHFAPVERSHGIPSVCVVGTTITRLNPTNGGPS